MSVPSSEMILELQLQLQVATVREDYAEAARLRDMVKVKTPVVGLKTLMEKAIAEERYVEAARYRDELSKVSPQKLISVSNATVIRLPRESEFVLEVCT